jgi:hypothetical protein
MKVVNKLEIMYKCFMEYCCVGLGVLKSITLIICDNFYKGKLTIEMLQLSYRMLSQLD